MSTKLFWGPVHEPQGNLPTVLKFILRKRWSYPIKITLNLDDIEYLQGIADTGVDGAQDLIDAIKHLGQIRLEERE